MGIVKRDGSTTDCVSFYTDIMANLKGLNTDTYKTLSRLTGTPDINAIKGMNNIMLANIQSIVFNNSGTINHLCTKFSCCSRN